MSLYGDDSCIKVLSVEPIYNYKLRIRLSNGKSGFFDVSPYLDKGVFTQLRDSQYFQRVQVAFGGMMWPHEQYFSPETIEYELRETP